jgi:peptidoglycan/LPS O-acetylase OafA/YrhL
MRQFQEKSTDRKLRLEYLDGIRGLTALYVVMHHVWEYSGGKSSPLGLPFTRLLQYGGFSVAIFIVLSGYCLMLPVARSKKGYISGSLVDYFKRRGRRILPAYYLAIVFCVLLSLAILVAQTVIGLPWSDVGERLYSPNFSFFDVLSHLLLIHNFFEPPHIWTINGPMWSIALEWQIYFLFPFLLLPIWRRFGLLPAVGTAFLVGLTPHFLLNRFMEMSHPWFVGVFALGMAAADIGFSQKPSLIWLRKYLPWGMLTAIFASFAFITHRLILPQWFSESFAGLTAACMLIYCTNFFIDGKRFPLIVRLLEMPIPLALGKFSYSLYLFHAPVLIAMIQFLLSLHLSNTMMMAMLYLVVVPMLVGICYLFYLVFERPFLSGSFQKRNLWKREHKEVQSYQL